jgi:putative redox protein
MKAEVTWRDELTFLARTENKSELTLRSGGSEGDAGSLRPMELIALGLAGCTAMDVISILQKKHQQVTEFQVQVHAERANDHPRVFTHIVLEYHITGNNVDEAAVLRSIELSAAKYCPAQAMLSPVVPIELNYKIYEVNDQGDQILQTIGEYKPEDM